MKMLTDWFEHRTGMSRLVHESLYEPIPGGARWRYVWGSTLVFAFFVQVVTGIVLWMAYSPGSQNAWESVYYIQHEMQGGWLLRGVHHFMAQAMVVLLAIHTLQVIIAGAYRAPREMNFWLGLVLLMITLGLALTGYLLPWDQKGYWATNVATNLMTLVPYVGEDLQKLVLGGTSYGHHTLTRFFALHAGVLPASLVIFLVAHIWLFRRHGITTPPSTRPTQYFWPDQILRDAVASLGVLAVVLLMTIHWDIPAVLRGDIDTYAMGAELAGPAEPSESYAAARPEWYFLALFQLLKPEYEPIIHSEFVGAIVLPTAIMGFMFLMPFIGRWKLGHRFNILFTFSLLLVAAFLTWQAYRADHAAVGVPFDPDRYEDAEKQRLYELRWQGSRDFLSAKKQAHRESRRMVEMIQEQGGIPATGAITLYRSDPVIQGPKLFQLHCASCHPYRAPQTSDVVADGADAAQDETEESASGQPSIPVAAPPATPDIETAEQSGANLYGFGSRQWVAGMLDPQKIAHPDFLGATAFADGEMVSFIRDMMVDLGEEEQTELNALIVALSAEAELPYQAELDRQATEEGLIEQGQEALVSLFSCVDCHKYHDNGDLGTAPDLTGYASAQWLREFLANPEHERFYADNNDRMPGYATNTENPQLNTLSPDELELLVRWLRGDTRPLTQP